MASEGIETLQNDLKGCITGLKDELGPLVSPLDIANHLKNSLWPFLETMVTQMSEQDEVIEDIVSDAEDILQPETAQEILVAITAGQSVVNELRKRLSPDWVESEDTRKETAKIIAPVRIALAKAAQTIAEITVVEVPEEEGEDDEDEDESDEGSQP